MKNTLKSWIVWAIIWMSPLSWSANDKIDPVSLATNTQLSAAITQNVETTNQIVSPRVATDAVLKYIDEEVKVYKLKTETKQKLESILYSYFSAHWVLKVWKDKKLIFEIDNKVEFSRVVKEVVHVLLGDMPVLIRKMAVFLFFGGEHSLDNKLDNLQSTVRNMKKKEYRNIVFDYLWWIIKRVAKSVDWNMNINEYYKSVSKQYPNKHSEQVFQELKDSWQWENDIKTLKYPFK